jgi:hypothetical protein
MSFLGPKSSQQAFGGTLLTLTVVTYTDAYLISLGTRGLFGFMHETSSNNTGLTPDSHRILLGDRDDLVSALFAEKLGSRAMRTGSAGLHKIVSSLSVPKELMMNKDSADAIVDWTLSCIFKSD